MPRKSTDWDVRTNLNASPGAQGTLFSGGTKYSSDARFPRGYTPDRLREVADHVIEPQIKNYTDGRGRVEVKGVESTNARSFAPRALGGDVVDKSPIRNVVDTIARSTVPVEHLQNLQFSSHHGIGRHQDSSLTELDEHGGGAAGLYSPAGSSGVPANAHGRASIRVLPTAAGTSTVIHEIGHHVSRTVADTSHSNYGNAAQQGREEGFADDYAQEHFRDRRGRQVERGTYGGGVRSSKRNEMFYQEYHHQRNMIDPKHAAYYAPAGGQRPGLPSDPQEHVFGQQPLINKMVAGGKHHAEINIEATPGYKGF